jgi:hypothetical protein
MASANPFPKRQRKCLFSTRDSSDDENDDSNEGDVEYVPSVNKKRKLTKEEREKAREEKRAEQLCQLQITRVEAEMQKIQKRSADSFQHEQIIITLYKRNALFLSQFLNMVIEDRSVRQRMRFPDCGLMCFDSLTPFADVFTVCLTNHRSLAACFNSYTTQTAARKLLKQNKLIQHFGFQNMTADFIKGCVETNFFVNLKLAFLNAPDAFRACCKMREDSKVCDIIIRDINHLPHSFSELDKMNITRKLLRSVVHSRVRNNSDSPYFFCERGQWTEDTHLCVSKQRTIEAVKCLLCACNRIGFHGAITTNVVHAWIDATDRMFT